MLWSASAAQGGVGARRAVLKILASGMERCGGVEHLAEEFLQARLERRHDLLEVQHGLPFEGDVGCIILVHSAVNEEE